MQNKYMNHILKSPAFASIHLVPEVDWQRQVLERLEKIRLLDKKRPV